VCNRSERTAGAWRQLFVWLAGFSLLIISVWPTARAHLDLLTQIEELTKQLEQQPDNVELLLKRGDLQRRHENLDIARADFKRVREIQPDNKTIDWFEGRLEVESGRPESGISYLDRYLDANPGQVIALQNRARAHLMLGQPLLAAQDFQTVIQVSDKPAPSLYSSNAQALVVAGRDYYPQAMTVVRAGLEKFPAEIMLTGIGTDISLARADTVAAAELINSLPDPILQLQQWQLRKALLVCETGNKEPALSNCQAKALEMLQH